MLCIRTGCSPRPRSRECTGKTAVISAYHIIFPSSANRFNPFFVRTSVYQAVLRLIEQPVRLPLFSPESIHWPLSARTVPDDRYPVASYPSGRAQAGTLGVSGRPRTGKGTRSMAAKSPGATGAAGRAGWSTGGLIQIGPPCGWTARSCARHASAVDAPQSAEPDHARGHSRGGSRTQIHSLTERRSHPLCLRVTGGAGRRATSLTPIVAWGVCT